MFKVAVITVKESFFNDDIIHSLTGFINTSLNISIENQVDNILIEELQKKNLETASFVKYKLSNGDYTLLNYQLIENTNFQIIPSDSNSMSHMELDNNYTTLLNSNFNKVVNQVMNIIYPAFDYARIERPSQVSFYYEMYGEIDDDSIDFDSITYNLEYVKFIDSTSNEFRLNSNTLVRDIGTYAILPTLIPKVFTNYDIYYRGYDNPNIIPIKYNIVDSYTEYCIDLFSKGYYFHLDNNNSSYNQIFFRHNQNYDTMSIDKNLFIKKEVLSK